jgi:hypothetical protein
MPPSGSWTCTNSGRLAFNLSGRLSPHEAQHGQSYADILVVAVLIPVVATGTVILLGCLTL